MCSTRLAGGFLFRSLPLPQLPKGHTGNARNCISGSGRFLPGLCNDTKRNRSVEIPGPPHPLFRPDASAPARIGIAKPGFFRSRGRRPPRGFPDMGTQKRQTTRRLIGIDQKTAPSAKQFRIVSTSFFNVRIFFIIFLYIQPRRLKAIKKHRYKNISNMPLFFLALFYIYLKYHH